MNARCITLGLALAALSFGAAAVRADAVDRASESMVAGTVTSDDLAALANEVNLSAWTQLATGRDFSTIEENWALVYSPKDEVGAARDWRPQVSVARSLAARAASAGQRRWLGLFVQAGEAVGRKDAAKFTAALRALSGEAPASRSALASNSNFFRAK
jgi:hypothetical protein